MADPVPFDTVLAEWFRRRGLHKRLHRHQALALWPQVAGEVVAAHTRAVGWRGEALLVVVDHPVWAQQLSLLRETLVQRLNARLGQATVRDLRFEVGAGRLQPDADRTPAGSAAQAGPAPCRGQSDPPAWLPRTEDPGSFLAPINRYSRRALARRRPAACRACGSPVEAGAPPPAGAPVAAPDLAALCPVCRCASRPGGTLWLVRRIQAAEPWLDQAEMGRRIPDLDARIYRYVRETLEWEWKQRLHQALAQAGPPAGGPQELSAMRDAALRYVMLQTSLKPGRLTDEVVRQILGPVADRLFGGFTEGETGVAPASWRRTRHPGS